jgi:hypothetical protein
LHGAASIAVALVLVACGGVAPSAAPPVSPSTATLASLSAGDPCGLIPDVAGAVGRAPIASPNTYAVGPTQRCMWIVARDPSRYVGVSLGPAANHGATIDALGDGETVEGLGDDARWWAAARTLSVVVGDQSLQVDLQLDDADATKEVATALAVQALATLAGS